MKFMPASDVPYYVYNNHSTKIFPFVWTKHPDDIHQILQGVSEFAPPVPIVLLTRDGKSVYESYLKARETSVWTANTNGIKRPLNSSIWNSPEEVQKAKKYAK